MKCEVCLDLLEEYFDGELLERESGEVAAHLMTCAACAVESAALSAEQELFSRYDRELEVPSLMWTQIAAQTAVPKVSRNSFGEWLGGLFRVPSFGFSVATAALILIAVLLSALFPRTHKERETLAGAVPHSTPKESPKQSSALPKPPEKEIKAGSDLFANSGRSKARRPVSQHSPVDQSDVVSAEFGSQDPDDRDTAKHIEQTQNLLRSIRNVQVNDGEQEIDVTYDKALSRRLLNENIVLRRDAEMKAKFPTKALLSDLEPFLIDIANLPDQAKPDDVRAIKERVQKTEIVAALIGYE